jgi:hypothetical protein
MARNPLYPRAQNQKLSPYDRLQKTIQDGIQQVAKTKQQNDLISYYRQRDSQDAIDAAKEDLDTKESNWKRDYYDPIVKAIAEKKYDEADYYLGERGEGENSIYTMRFDSMVRPENKKFFKSADELKADISAGRNVPSNPAAEYDAIWFSNDPSIPVYSKDQNKVSKDFAYDGYVDLLANGGMSIEDFNRRMTFSKDRFGTELGISPAVSKGGPSADGIQSDLNKQNMSMTGFTRDNFYTKDKAFEYYKTLSNDFKAQVANTVFKKDNITAENFNIVIDSPVKQEKLERELWAIETSRRAKVLMDDLASSTLYRKPGEPTLFDITEQGAKGKSPQSQAIVNNFVSLAIESIPDLRRENDTAKLKKMLQDDKYKNQIIQTVSDYLGPTENWIDYLTSDRFRLKIIAD